MKRIEFLLALLVSLGGCGPSIAVDDDAASASTGGMTETDATSTTDVMPTSTSYEDGYEYADYDSYDGYEYDGYEYDDGGCWEEIVEGELEVPRSDLERWLDERGQITGDGCWAACTAVGIAETWDAVLACMVTGDAPPPPDTDGDESGTDGASGTDGEETEGTTGGPGELVQLACVGAVVFCDS
jgi:hypothetical protein